MTRAQQPAPGAPALAGVRRGKAETAPAYTPPNALVSLRWDSLHISPLNPRHRVDAERLRELANSIAFDGVLQNLVVRTRAGSFMEYEIISGTRRWRAVKLLVEEGGLAPDVTIPARIVEKSDLEFLHMATVENMQRQDMTPLEEADAFAQMIELGDTSETIAAVTGLSKRTVDQRLALHHRLAPAVRSALEAGEVNLGQAQAFTLGEKPAQERLINHVAAHPQGYRAADIRRTLLERTVPLSRAIFMPAAYKGKFVRDLFEDETHACDLDEFCRLQAAACEAKRAELAQTWSWAEFRNGGWVATWEFDRDGEPAQSGAIVHLRDDLRVEIHTGLIRREPAVIPGSTRSPAPPRVEEKGPLSRAHIVWAKHVKTRRLQWAIAQHPRAAGALAILGLLGAEEVRIRTGVNWGVPGPDDAVDHPELEALTEGFAGPLQRGNLAERFRHLMEMDPASRSLLFAALVAAQCGSWPGYSPELGDSELAIAIAETLGVAELEPFTLTSAYLERLSRDQLARVADQANVKDWVANLKKGEMIDIILLDDGRDPAFYPPELKFAPRAAIEAELARAAKTTAAAE